MPPTPEKIFGDPPPHPPPPPPPPPFIIQWNALQVLHWYCAQLKTVSVGSLQTEVLVSNRHFYPAWCNQNGQLDGDIYQRWGFYWNKYCKFGNFPESLIFGNSFKRQICHVKNSRLWHDLSTSVNDSVISPFREVSFHEFRGNKTLTKISEFTVYGECFCFCILTKTCGDGKLPGDRKWFYHI